MLKLSFRLAIAALLLLSSLGAFADSSRDRASFGREVVVDAGESSGDIACAFCSVQIHGDVQGDVAVLFGNVSVDSGHAITGDVALLGGDLILGDDTQVGGDVAIAAGDLNASPGASVRGHSAVFPGRLWLLVPLLPLLILAGIIWLIVYVVRRNRYQFPAYPNGRGIPPSGTLGRSR